MRWIIVAALLVIFGFTAYANEHKLKQNTSQPDTNKAKNYVEPKVESNQQINTKVEIDGDTFDPASITVKSGEPVIFVNNDDEKHTITADDKKFDVDINQGQNVTITLGQPGTYSYFCKPHLWMKGKIIVQ